MQLPLILLSLVVLASPPGEAAAEAGRLPAVNRNRTTPVWIPVSEAFSPTGGLKPSLFYNHEIEFLENAPPSDGDTVDCPTRFGEVACDHYERVDTLFALVSNSLTIVIGEVMSIEEGFYFGIPGILLEVRLSSESRLSTAVRPTNGVLYVHYPWSSFAHAGKSYCTWSIGHPSPPAVGDRIIAFIYLEPSDRAGRLVSPGSKQVAFTSGDGLSLPRQIVDDPLLIGVEDFDVLLDRIRSLQMPRAADAASD